MTDRPPVDFPAAARRAIAARDLDRCARCGRPLGPGANAHHRMLRSRGGRGTIANGVLLCGSGTTGCHGWAHGHIAEATAVGLLVPSWETPSEWPMLTWRGWMLIDEIGGWTPTTEPAASAALRAPETTEGPGAARPEHPALLRPQIGAERRGPTE